MVWWILGADLLAEHEAKQPISNGPDLPPFLLVPLAILALAFHLWLLWQIGSDIFGELRRNK